MAVSPFASSLRSRPGYIAPPAATAAYAPNFPALSALPTVPAIDEARAPQSAFRSWLASTLGPMATTHNAALTGIQATAKTNLAGYGGWGFGSDDPATAQREDLLLNYDPRQALRGERNKADYRAQVNAASDRGLLYSSIANQNIAAGQQRLTLEAQQIANQYATAINTQQSAYAGQVSSTVRDWTTAYGQDAMWLSDNPPAPVATPPPTSGPGSSSPSGGREWLGSKPPSIKSLAKQWGVPESAIRVTPINNFSQYWAYIPSELPGALPRQGY